MLWKLWKDDGLQSKYDTTSTWHKDAKNKQRTDKTTSKPKNQIQGKIKTNLRVMKENAKTKKEI